MARLVNVTIPVESVDDEGLHKFMTAMAVAMDKVAHMIASEYGVTILDLVEGEELVPLPSVEPAEREEI